MVYKEHYIELYINGHKMDLESQKSLNLRFQSVLYDPEKITSTQADYSFEFELPSTPNNDKVFDYANNLSRLNKFHQRWNAEVYADGSVIFEGSLTLNGFKNGMYQCNLVSVKQYNIEDIFGEDVMTNIPWEIPFNGAGDGDYTINYYNSGITEGTNNEVCFPLASYGVFQKAPYNQDEVANDYSSKFDFDQYNRWYVESFAPSLSLLETIKKAFQYKGYNVSGNIFNNALLRDIFMSCNLADEQSPTYNLGNPKFGKVELSVSWSTPMNGSAYTQSLNFPYARLGGGMNAEGKFANYSWNFENIQVYDMLDEGTVSVSNPSYLYQPYEHIIVIPADGFYKITLSGNSKINSSQTSFQANQLYQPYLSMGDVQMGEVEIPVNARKYMPFEIQLVRNYDDNIELIKGVNNFVLADGFPLHTTQCDAGYNTNYYSIYSSFPHEKCGSAFYYGDTAALHGSAGAWIYAPPTDITHFGDELNKSLYNFEPNNNMGYLFNDGDIMAYDPAVNSDFILGFTSMGNDNGGGCPAVIKNGYSWSKTISERYDALYPQNPGYWKANTGRRVDGVPDWNITTTPSNHNQNNYANSFNFYQSNNTAMNGQIQCLVHLKKNDVLQLFAVQRDYTHNGDQVQYNVQADYNLSIEAISPKAYAYVRGYDANHATDFDINLKLSNFLNAEKKISEWLQNVIDAFNLEVIQNGTNVDINVKKPINRNMSYAVDIDDRVNSADAEASRINYPAEMAVKYKIDTDEWGFERSVVEAAGGDESILNDPNWKASGDSGYTIIKLNDDAYETSKSEKSLQFSYSWYDNFNWYEVDYDGQLNPYMTTVTLRLPVISKYTYMIDGYDYGESMKHDGYGLSQRFWFRPTAAQYTHTVDGQTITEIPWVWTETYPRERVDLYIPSNIWTGGTMACNLSYKTTEPSLLNNFFSITPYLASNYVQVDVYLSPEEYKSIKNGAMVHLDSDLYIPVSISGFDPTGNNPTELKLIKKV